MVFLQVVGWDILPGAKMTNFLMEEDSQLRMWAYDPDSFKSVGQDFELTVAGLHRASIILECASDNECPMQHFFVNCAYLIVGNLMSPSSYSLELERDVLAFLRQAEKTGNKHLLEFVWRARYLIENPSEFDCDQWCGGVLARKSFVND